MQEEQISKAEFARLLGLSRARVTQLVEAGLPICGDGRIPVARARAWYTSRVRCAMKPARGVKAGNAVSTARQIIDRLLVHAADLPGLVLALGGTMPAAIAASDLFDVFLNAALGGNLLAEIYGGDDRIPAVRAPDTAILGKSVGLDYDSSWELAADDLLARAQEYLRRNFLPESDR